MESCFLPAFVADAKVVDQADMQVPVLLDPLPLHWQQKQRRAY